MSDIGREVLSEFLGTMVLIILGNGAVATVNYKRMYGNGPGKWVLISIAWGLAVMFGVLVSSALKGNGHLNPAVSMFAWVSDKNFGHDRFFSYVIVQILGAIVAQIILNFINWKHIHETEQGFVRGAHCTAPNFENGFLYSCTTFLNWIKFRSKKLVNRLSDSTNSVLPFSSKSQTAAINRIEKEKKNQPDQAWIFNFTYELVGTLLLVGLILVFITARGLENDKVKAAVEHNNTFSMNQIPIPATPLNSMRPIPVTLLVVAIGMSVGGATGYAINPARDLGPRIVYWITTKFVMKKYEVDANWKYAWIPIVAPLLGGLIIGLFGLIPRATDVSVG